MCQKRATGRHFNLCFFISIGWITLVIAEKLEANGKIFVGRPVADNFCQAGAVFCQDVLFHRKGDVIEKAFK